MPKKISQLTAKGSKIEATDLLEISQFTGGIYVSKSVTGSNLMEVSLDTSPQLGGDLDINGNKIISTSNGNISIQPNGTGAVLIGGNSTQATELRFLEDSDNGSNYVALRSSNTLASNTTYTLPTADGSSGQVLSTNGSGTLSWATAGGGGLTVGTTAISSGTVGRILFEGTGNVLQEDAALFWDNTNKRLGIGATPSSTVRLDIRAQSSLSTDTSIRVRRSDDAGDQLQFLCNGVLNIGQAPAASAQGHIFNINNGGSGGVPFIYASNNSGFNFDVDRWANIKTNFGLIQVTSATGSLVLGLGTAPTARNFQQTIASLTAISQGTNDSGFVQVGADTSSNGAVYSNYIGKNWTLGSTSQGNGKNVLAIVSQTAPSNNITDAFQVYSADITAGNAAPHFRTENGNIVKIYQETTGVAAATLVGGGGTALTSTDTFDGYTLQQVVKALRNLGILA